MSALVVRLLLCDGTDDGEVCPAELCAEDGVTSLAQLRKVAYRDHGWSTKRGDFCPEHNTLKDVAR